jgi:hypothetical protein
MFLDQMPCGAIGTSYISIIAWTWEDAIMENDDAPLSYKKSGSWFEPGTIEEK